MPDNPISKAKEEKNRFQISQLMEENVILLPEYKQEIPDTPRFVILHCSTPKIIWDWFILIFILYTATSVPFIVCFKFDSFPMTVADTLVDVMFLTDIVFNFHTSYVGDNGAIVFDVQQIRRMYFHSWFFVDLVTSLPYGLLGLLVSGSIGRGITDLISFLKAIRLLRLNRVVRALDQYLEYGFITLILWILFFCLCAHWMACIFYAIAEHYDGFTEIGWVQAMSEQTQQPLVIVNGTIVDAPTLASLYMTSLYFSLTSLTSIGFGNIAPNTTAEKIFSCVTMIFGGLCYAVIFGQVTAIVQQSQKKSESYHQTLDNMRSFCKLYNVPKEISTRIVDYYMYTWVLNRGVDTNQVLLNCPKDLQSDICIHLNRKIIDGTPAFGELSNAVLRAVARNFAIHRVAPGERLVHEGESLDTLFFIGSGSFEVIQKGKLVGLLGEGDVFGDDICRYNDIGRSAADVFALTYADVHAIARDELMGALAFYPEYGLQFAKVFRLSYNLRDEVIMRKLSSHPRGKSHLIARGMEDRKYSIVEEMQQHGYDTDSNGGDLGTPNSQNMTDTDPPSKPLKFAKPRQSYGNVMEGIPEHAELDTSVVDDDDFKRWSDYQNTRDVSEGLLNEITGMKSEVRHEIEVMGGKMNQLERNISTILSLLQEQGLKSPGSQFNSNFGLQPPMSAASTHSKTANIISRVKAEMSEDILPDWVEMENFGMAGNAKDDGTVNDDGGGEGEVVEEEKIEEEKIEEEKPKKVGGRITKKRKIEAKRKKKKAEKASKSRNESESEDPEATNEVVLEGLLDGLLDETASIPEHAVMATSIPEPAGVEHLAPEDEEKSKRKKKKGGKHKDEASDAIEMTEVAEDRQDEETHPEDDAKDSLTPVGDPASQHEAQNDDGKKKRKKKEGEKKRKNEEKEEAIPSEIDVSDHLPAEPRETSPLGRVSRQSQPEAPQNEDAQSKPVSPRPGRHSRHEPEQPATPEHPDNGRSHSPNGNDLPKQELSSSGKNSPSGEKSPSSSNTPRVQSPERQSPVQFREASPVRSEPGQDDRLSFTPGETESGRDSRQGAPGDVALTIEDSDEAEKDKPSYTP